MKKESISDKVKLRRNNQQKGILIMATLPQFTLDFNRQIKLSNDGGELSSDTGEFLFREFDEKIGFSATLAKFLNLQDNRRYYVHRMKTCFAKRFIRSLLGIPKTTQPIN